uniref:Uncharacterized protein n=1 Tax=Anguilla anguilla TaxID=7936 RepID=A0A0E9U769_ANGAN
MYFPFFLVVKCAQRLWLLKAYIQLGQHCSDQSRIF